MRRDLEVPGNGGEGGGFGVKGNIKSIRRRMSSIIEVCLQKPRIYGFRFMRSLYGLHLELRILRWNPSAMDATTTKGGVRSELPAAEISLVVAIMRHGHVLYVTLNSRDQLPVSTKFDMRIDPGVVRNYGRLLLEMVAAVPDGIVCFFVSYSYMDDIVNSWNEMGILQEVLG